MASSITEENKYYNNKIIIIYIYAVYINIYIYNHFFQTGQTEGAYAPEETELHL